MGSSSPASVPRDRAQWKWARLDSRPGTGAASRDGGGERWGGEAMSDFDEALRGFAALDEQALARPWSWRDKAMDVRFALYRTLEDAQEARVRLSDARYPESRRILALAQRAFGDLRGLLAGLRSEEHTSE